MVNKRIAKFVYSCVDFVFAKISPLHHTFTLYYTIIHFIGFHVCVRMIHITHFKDLGFYYIGSYNSNIFSILMSSKKGNLKSRFMICFVDLPYYIKRFHYKKMVVTIMTKMCGVSWTRVAKLGMRLEWLHEGNVRIITCPILTIKTHELLDIDLNGSTTFVATYIRFHKDFQNDVEKA